MSRRVRPFVSVDSLFAVFVQVLFSSLQSVVVIPFRDICTSDFFPFNYFLSSLLSSFLFLSNLRVSHGHRLHRGFSHPPSRTRGAVDPTHLSNNTLAVMGLNAVHPFFTSCSLQSVPQTFQLLIPQQAAYHSGNGNPRPDGNWLALFFSWQRSL